MKKHSLKEKMELAACLPPNDPFRQKIERRCAQLGGEVAQQWLGLLSENDQLRLRLHHGESPPDLERRLLSLPRRGLARPGRWLVAAGVLLSLLLGAYLLSAYSIYSRLQTLGLLAVDSHLNDRRVELHENDPEKLARGLDAQPVAMFAARPRPPRPRARLVGGRHCCLGLKPVIYTLWEGPEPISVFQFRRQDFGLPHFGPRTLSIAGPALEPDPVEVTFWLEGDTGYAVVTGAYGQSPMAVQFHAAARGPE
ncbi:MAG: hypothetical protein HY319_18435 [Armatimonadetes bacterium]|nr:hypothetical protein [Armatimonadota bacterium]